MAYIIGTNGPFGDVLNGTAADDTISGLAGNDWLKGGGGNDGLNGGSGADVLDGGTGIDTALYYDSDAGVGVSLRTGQGFGGTADGDTLINIENLIGSSFDDGLEGDDGANQLFGLGGNDVLRGNGGADRLDGGAGIDTALYVDSNRGVSVNLAIGQGFFGSAEGDTLFNIENLVGSSFGDTLVGNDGANALDGRDGNDLLIGGAGADHLDGGLGIDTASYTDSTAAVGVNLTTGLGFGGTAAGDTLANIENLVGTQFNDSFIGNNASNDLNGLNGNDILSGGGGNDTLEGGYGDDILKGGGGADALIGGPGTDTADYSDAPGPVFVDLGNSAVIIGVIPENDAKGDTFSGIENITGSAYGDLLIGDGGANVIQAGGGDDTLGGLGGNDVLYGGTGNDSYQVEDPGDVVIEYAGQGFDRVDALVSYTLAPGSEVELLETAAGPSSLADINLGGNEFNNTIIGNAGNNNIAGGAGQDVLVGGMGQDFLTGGAGGDVFVWSSIAETQPAGQLADVVTDFNRLEGDLLAVNQIDADGNAANGDQAFTFVGFVDFTGTHQFTGAGQIGFFTTPTDTFILLNTVVNPGPGGIDFEEATIHLTGVHTPDASWFVL